MIYTTLEQLKKDLGIEHKNIENMTTEELEKYFINLYQTIDSKVEAMVEHERYDFYLYDEEERESRTGKNYINWFNNERNNPYDDLSIEVLKQMENQADECQNEIVERTKRIAKTKDISDYTLIHNNYFNDGEFWASNSWDYDIINELWSDLKHSLDRFNLIRAFFIDECIGILKQYSNQ